MSHKKFSCFLPIQLFVGNNILFLEFGLTYQTFIQEEMNKKLALVILGTVS